MSYKINKTNGALLVDLIDGRVDNDTTDLTLIGRNYTGYGEDFNENFVKILENFANTGAPSNPLVGQLWYDTSEVRLKVYNGQSFIATSATIVSSTTPPSLAAGELWVDTANKQLKFSDGSNTFLAGPIYTIAQGKSGLDVETLLDEFGNSKVVVRLLIAAQPVAIISRESFNTATAIPNFDAEIKEGINISSLYPDFLYHGTAKSALSLSGILANGFLRTDPASEVVGNTTTGILKIQTDLGLTVGDNTDFKLLISNNNTVFRSQTSDAGIKFQVNTGPTVSEAFLTDYLTVNTVAGNVGIWQDDPQYNLDVTGNVRITGNLRVEGTFLDSSKNIAFSLDTTGLSNSAIATVIESLVSSATKSNNVEALIHCTEYSGTSTYNASDGLSKTFVTVDKAGTENQSVVADVAFNFVNSTVALTVSRTLKRFRVVTGAWTYIEDVS
jgi:hypothetical protein